MGTNYYAVRSRPTVSQPIHIGKASHGWLFLFQYQREWQNFDELKRWLHDHIGYDYVIINEYDEQVSEYEFLQMVEHKQKDPFNLANPDNYTNADNVNGYRFTEGDFS